MSKRLRELILFSFYLLFALVPLILYPKTSELFEFNKIIATYSLTSIIVGLWLSRMIVERKFIFRRTILDIPILVFLGTQVLSTIVSIDPRSSVLGYYSRFHGGLLSSISYSLLYWTWVSNIKTRETIKAFYLIGATAILVSVYGVLERLGIDKNIWVQDVQNRVFSTLGQPNWLAAWLVATIPLTWSFYLKSRDKKFLYIGALFTTTLLFTKSRSGIIGFFAAFVAFLGGFFYLKKESIKKSLKTFLPIPTVFLLLIFLFGTPWNPSISSFFDQSTQEAKVEGPALEVGGTESGEIRKIVWSGAINIFKNYPVLGTGVETFAYSYYNFRPIEHNLVSEWDFLYNKAHNEFLNIAANTGFIGLASYLTLIGFSTFVIINNFLKGKNKLLNLALASGYLSISVTNFFGFSVVPVAIIFFLFPAFSTTLESDPIKENDNHASSGQKVLISLVSAFVFYTLFIIARYWYADLSYARAKLLNDSQDPVAARQSILKAIKISSKEAIYWNEFSDIDTSIAVSLQETGDEERVKEFANSAVIEAEKATELSPKNVNIKRNQASMYLKLSAIDPNYLLKAKETLLEAIMLAPTDAKLFYNLGLTDARIGNIEDATRELEYTVKIKGNYRDARLALALLQADQGLIKEAKENLNYILENINPGDELTRQQLEELGN